MSNKIYHAAIYVRLSKEDGDNTVAGKAESNSISNQKNLIKDFLKNKTDIVVVSERVDDGYTGSNFERPAFQMMLEDIKKGIVDCVIVKDFSRFGRDYIDGGRFMERIFPRLGVRFISINDNYDSASSAGEADDIVIPFKNLINDAYCRDISIKIRTNLDVKRKNGEYISPFAPYGYKKDAADKHKIIIDSYAANIVKDIFRMKINGMSQDAIANVLNDRGVLSPMEYKNMNGSNYRSSFKTNDQALWSSVTVRRILENEIYIGNLIQGKRTTPNHKVKRVVTRSSDEWIRIEHNHEAIISDRDFELVQQLLGMDTRTSPGKEGVYILSGIAVCADCGMPMTRKTTSAGGKKYEYYVCSTNKASKSQCSAHSIPADKLESIVFELLQQHIHSVMDIEDVLDFIGTVPFQELDVKRIEEQKDLKKNELIRYKNLRTMLYEDMKDGIISKDDYTELHTAYENKCLQIEKSIRNLDTELRDIIENVTNKYSWINYFKEYEDIKELTRNVVVKLISKVVVRDKKHVDIEFQCDDLYQSTLEYMRKYDSHTE